MLSPQTFATPSKSAVGRPAPLQSISSPHAAGSPTYNLPRSPAGNRLTPSPKGGYIRGASFRGSSFVGSSAGLGSATPSYGRGQSVLSGEIPTSSGQVSSTGWRRSSYSRRAKVIEFDSSSSEDEAPQLGAEEYAKPWLEQLRDGTCRKRFRATARFHKQRAKGHEAYPHPYPRVRRCVRSRGFEAWLTAVIVLNCIYVGWQADLPAEDKKPQEVKAVEIGMQHVFNVCFVLELICRVLCDGWTYLLLRENLLDVFLVFLSLMLATLDLFSDVTGAETKGAQTLRKLTVLRTLRLIKLAKAVRRRPEFKEMWSLLRGLGDSMETLFWTYVLINCVLYFFGIMATTLIAKSGSFQGDDEVSLLVQDKFGDVPKAMVTLFQVMTLDSWTGIMRPLMQEEAWIPIFFMLFISIAVFLLMNLITAVIVENAFKSAQEDEVQLSILHEQEKEREYETLIHFFTELDVDGDNVITPQELDQAKKDPAVRGALRAFGVSVQDLDLLFTLLDADGSGSIECEEFVAGVRRLKGEPKAKDLAVLTHLTATLSKSIDEVDTICEVTEKRMHGMDDYLKLCKIDLDKVKNSLTHIREAITYAAKTQKQPTPPPSPRHRRREGVAQQGGRASEQRKQNRHSWQTENSSSASESVGLPSTVPTTLVSSVLATVPSVSVQMASDAPAVAESRKSSLSSDSESSGSSPEELSTQGCTSAQLKPIEASATSMGSQRSQNLRVSFKGVDQVTSVAAGRRVSFGGRETFDISKLGPPT